nr:coatomer subunit beta [Polyrhizophydium stewartii]
MLNGDPLPQLLMHVIRFIMPSRNKALKKLLLLYWEICPKTNPDGKLKQEMVLVVNAIRNDLLHPNEYIRGQTLRFLCKLKESEILEPLVPVVRQCLEHRHPYVRKNAVLAIFAIYKILEHLIPDAPETIESYIAAEADHGCRRNAFIMLINSKMPVAVHFFSTIAAQIVNFDETIQLAAIELIRKDARSPAADKGKYIQTVFTLLTAASPSVRYEAASTLVALTSHASAIKAAVAAYIELAVKESDNNVKLIVLDRINELREKNDRVLEDQAMDILRVVSSPDIAVRRKCLNIAMELVSSRNVDEVVTFLKKELIKTHDQEYEKNNEYRQLVIQAIHSCAIKFSEVADSVVHVLMEFLGESNTASAVDVIAFVREVVEKFQQLRLPIISRLLETFGEMRTGRVFRGALWIIGEYAADASTIEEAFRKIRASIGELPILAAEQRLLAESAEGESGSAAPADNKDKKPETKSAARRVLADGTYATESALASDNKSAKIDASRLSSKPPLRALLLGGEYYVGAVLATALTKLALRYGAITGHSPRSNALTTEAMLIMTSILRVGKSDVVTAQIDEDSHSRILGCLRVLSSVPAEPDMVNAFLESCRNAFTNLVISHEKTKQSKTKEKQGVKIQADDVISFRFLKSKKTVGENADEFEADLIRATGSADRGDEYVSKLNRIIQLTGFSDPVYAEAYVTVHQYDILLDILIVNQTNETLQNLTVEFSTLGDLKLVERPQPHTMGPRGFHSIKANIKVASTETGVIYGNIVYDGASSLDVNCIILNDIHIDIMDYIKPATCSETQFRLMWTEFEWENKVNVNTTMTDLRAYLDHIMKSTNLNCLTPEHALAGECGFLAANLYARSIFGEDALANISLELTAHDKITGHIRIRSKTQGIALSLGDKITTSQKAMVAAV